MNQVYTQEDIPPRKKTTISRGIDIDKAKKEEETFEHLQRKEFKQMIKLRRTFAFLIFFLLLGWLTTIMVILFLYGVSKLSDAVLITLISTTTANIAVYFLVVTRHLFPLQLK